MYRFALIFLLIFSFDAVGQKLKGVITQIENTVDLKVVYRNEASWSVYVHTAGGIGLNFRRGKQVNVDRKRMFEVETSNFKHPKEVRSDLTETFRSVYYGKINSIFLFRSGVGFQNVLFQKTNKKNVQIRYSTFLGGILAFSKPIYLEIKNSTSPERPKVERYDPTIHKRGDIYGKAPFFNGIGNTKIVPGAYAKFALSFEYGDHYNTIKALEAGVVADVYPTSIQIMANDKKQYLLFSLYLKMVWGRKWF